MTAAAAARRKNRKKIATLRDGFCKEIDRALSRALTRLVPVRSDAWRKFAQKKLDASS